MSVTNLHPQKMKSPVRLLYLDYGSCIGSRRTAASIMQVPKEGCTSHLHQPPSPATLPTMVADPWIDINDILRIRLSIRPTERSPQLSRTADTPPPLPASPYTPLLPEYGTHRPSHWRKPRHRPRHRPQPVPAIPILASKQRPPPRLPYGARQRKGRSRAQEPARRHAAVESEGAGRAGGPEHRQVPRAGYQQRRQHRCVRGVPGARAPEGCGCGGE